MWSSASPPEPLWLLEHIPLPSTGRVCTGRGCQVWPRVRSFEFSTPLPHELLVPRGRAACPLLSFGTSWGHSFACPSLGLEAECRTWPFLGLYMLFVLHVETFQTYIDSSYTTAKLPFFKHLNFPLLPVAASTTA